MYIRNNEMLFDDYEEDIYLTRPPLGHVLLECGRIRFLFTESIIHIRLYEWMDGFVPFCVVLWYWDPGSA